MNTKNVQLREPAPHKELHGAGGRGRGLRSATTTSRRRRRTLGQGPHVAAVDHLQHDAAELLGSIEAAGEAQAAVGGEGHGHERAAGWIGRQASA